jgi:hypothetical protein
MTAEIGTRRPLGIGASGVAMVPAGAAALFLGDVSALEKAVGVFFALNNPNREAFFYCVDNCWEIVNNFRRVTEGVFPSTSTIGLALSESFLPISVNVTKFLKQKFSVFISVVVRFSKRKFFFSALLWWEQRCLR